MEIIKLVIKQLQVQEKLNNTGTKLIIQQKEVKKERVMILKLMNIINQQQLVQERKHHKLHIIIQI